MQATNPEPQNNNKNFSFVGKRTKIFLKNSFCFTVKVLAEDEYCFHGLDRYGQMVSLNKQSVERIIEIPEGNHHGY